MPVDQGAGVKTPDAISNRPYHRGSRLGEVIEGVPVIYSGMRVGDIKLDDDDYITATILAACPRDRIKYLQALYDETYCDTETITAFNVIAYSKNLFGKAATKSDEGRAVVCNILRGVRAGMKV
jgi:hypothetical protein